MVRCATSSLTGTRHAVTRREILFVEKNMRVIYSSGHGF